MSEYTQQNDKAEFVDLKSYAFEAAGKCGGNITVFGEELKQIYSGVLVDQSTRTLTPEELEVLKRREENLQIDIDDITIDIERVESKLVDIENNINEKQNLLDEFNLGGLSPNQLGGQVTPPNKNVFAITSFFGIMLSAFIFFFYVAVVYKALFMSQEELLQGLRSGDFGINLLPNWSEISSAMSSNLMIIFAPFVFFAFGYAIHILISLKIKYKWLGIVAVVVTTFILDYLLALRIHERMNESQALMGLEENSAFADVLIVLIFGFVVYIIWSIIFHSWMTELNKRDIPNRLGNLIETLKEEKTALRDEKIDLRKNLGKLKNEKIQIVKAMGGGVSVNMINKSISIFATGWFNFLSGLGQKGERLIDECQRVFQQFVTDKKISVSPLKDDLI